jgi:superfamily II DNA/RNA helicase
LRVAGAAADQKAFLPTGEYSKHNHESVYPHLPTGVRHVLELVQEKDKYARLVSLLETRLESDDKKTARRVVVFFSSKARVDDATRSLRSDGFPALAMHGDKAQNEREWVLREFRTGTAPVLLATDVAARGLDVAGVATVINFDAPASAETFAHRVGRTGRRGGRASVDDVNTEDEETYTFLCPHARADAKVAGSFVATLRANGQEVSASVAAFASESEA